jgi:plasmid stabilization system protein ParE
VTRLVLSPRVFQDLERLTEFLLATDPASASKTGGLLIAGLQILKDHPLIGRTIDLGYRELVISRGRTGYVALYKYDVAMDLAIVYAIRHQREGGYAD